MIDPHRKRRLLVAILLTGAVAAVILPAAAKEPPPTTVLVVRHAEKEAAGDDPLLSPRGVARAEALARMLDDVPLAAVVSSQFRRTRDTVAPAGRDHDLPVEEFRIVDPVESMRDLAKKILHDYNGRTVLVAGHSNTVPRLLESLGVESPPDLTDADYGDLFVVTLFDGRVGWIRLKFGE